MRKYETGRLRNVALIAHGKAGKTTLAEAMLFDGGQTDRLGRVDEGTSVMDFEPEEIKRNLSISSSFHHVEWDKHKINLVDTPGDANFIMDTKNSLQAVDGAIIVVDAVSGVEVQTEKVWEYAGQFELPRLFFISKMDRERANFFQALAAFFSSPRWIVKEPTFFKLWRIFKKFSLPKPFLSKCPSGPKNPLRG